ncbi:MAG: histidinol-phosphate transaminase [Methylovulum sp.]|jgi:histidinol-phosphate aminotransferase|nr:histidinol-phosphate transaminase [Methylovulum sp.]MCF8006956.1 histidinol-phosphate transaminase [Methylovulum sp.]
MTYSAIEKLAVAGVQQLVPYKAGKPIEELERELGLRSIIKLASNENPLGPSPKALQAMTAMLSSLALYPDGSGFQLKRALAAKFAVESQQITLGNGSNELLELVARAFLTSDNEVVISQHAFAVYALVTQAIGAVAKLVPAQDYGHDLIAMRNAITPKTRLVFIANPNNPTGTLLSQEALHAFIAELPAHVLCVLDEAYFEFVSQTHAISSIDWLVHFPNLIITRTFSKAYGLAGLRIGYSFSSVAVADILNRVREPFNNNTLALVAAQAALDDTEHLANTVATNQRGMQQLTSGFDTLGLAWIPSAGNFVAVDLTRDALPMYNALLARGVIVRPVANYELPTFLRISVGTEAENAHFLHALSDCLAHVF